MSPSLRIVAFLALAAAVHAESLLVPRVVGDWQPRDPALAVQEVAEVEPGHFYLFRAQTDPKQPGTRVYHSTDAKDFGFAGKFADALHFITALPLDGAKVAQRDGQWFVVQGERAARLEWTPVPNPVTATSRKPGIAIRVALFDDSGSFGKGVPTVIDQLSKAKDIEVAKLDGDGIRAGLSGYDVVIFTGGSGGKQANTIGLLGREQVRRFVEAGGGYIGICAGAYLACDGFSWGVKVLDAKTPSSKWARGTADLEIEANDAGQKALGLQRTSTIRYVNGPVLTPANNPAIPDYEPLVFFRTETAKNGSLVGAQIDTPAMARGACGKGRVIVSSPHPEQTAGMERWTEHAVRAVAPR
ncbi:MAG: BPL-N domain-containing protein [Chthoniobacteraceae bacterium]